MISIKPDKRAMSPERTAVRERAQSAKSTSNLERMQDIIQALRAAWAEYKRVRWLQGGWRNPDEVPF